MIIFHWNCSYLNLDIMNRFNALINFTQFNPNIGNGGNLIRRKGYVFVLDTFFSSIFSAAFITDLGRKYSVRKACAE